MRTQTALRNLPAVIAAPLIFGLAVAAQTAAPPAQVSPHRATHAHRKSSARKPPPSPAVAQSAPVPVPCPAAGAAPVAPSTVPCIPNWPANNKPAEATISWDSRGLFIQASNSSLDQILHEVALKTGMKVEGMGTDERIFGAYGPGPAGEVLTELLDGSGYNILLVGDLGQGTPRRVVLSGRPTGAAPASGAPQYSPEYDQEQTNTSEETPPGPTSQPEMPGSLPPPPVPARNQQIMMQQQQLMEQRRQQMLEQQQINSQNPQ